MFHGRLISPRFTIPFHNVPRSFYNVSWSFRNCFAIVSKGPRSPLVSDALRFADVSQRSTDVSRSFHTRFTIVSQVKYQGPVHEVTNPLAWYLTSCFSGPFHSVSRSSFHDCFTMVSQGPRTPLVSDVRFHDRFTRSKNPPGI